MSDREMLADRKRNADLVVIGGGGSGLAAALTAAEKGAKVIVLEKRTNPGGNSVLAFGFFSIGRPGQDREEIDNLIDAYFLNAMSYSHWKTDPGLVRGLLERSVDIVPWLEKQGCRFEFDSAIGLYQILGKSGGGANLMKALAGRCKEMGIPVICGTRARRLLTGKRGQITGVVAENDREEITIETGNVILASGGFAGNETLLKKYFPGYDANEVHTGGIPHQGDGLLMAVAAGAATDGLAFMELSSLVFPESTSIGQMAVKPCTLWVNMRGERFVNESLLSPEYANSIYRQPQKRFYALFDEKIKQNIYGQGVNPMMRQAVSGVDWVSQTEKDLDIYAGKDRVKISGSWAEIAAWMGIHPGILEAAVNDYNACCDRGHDIFLKNRQDLMRLDSPPYYAIKCVSNLLVTHGDIKVNRHLAVLDKQDDPIPGLYAVGDDASLADSETYNMKMGGHSLGFAINSGRIAAEAVVKSLAWEKQGGNEKTQVS